ncbi:hypothetical protein VCRA2120E57_40175 [Vibrio crassostreae]|nr:hypothetical protein VCRA2120E57_40175 [Vibrio crassostreae]
MIVKICDLDSHQVKLNTYKYYLIPKNATKYAVFILERAFARHKKGLIIVALSVYA